MFSYVFVRLRNTNLFIMYRCKTIIGWSNIYHAHYIAISFGNVRAADQLRNYTEPYPSIFILSAALDLHQLRRGGSGWRSCRLHDMYENFSLPAFMSFHVFFVYGREHFPIFLNVDSIRLSQRQTDAIWNDMHTFDNPNHTEAQQNLHNNHIWLTSPNNRLIVNKSL